MRFLRTLLLLGVAIALTVVLLRWPFFPSAEAAGEPPLPSSSSPILELVTEWVAPLLEESASTIQDPESPETVESPSERTTSPQTPSPARPPAEAGTPEGELDSPSRSVPSSESTPTPTPTPSGPPKEPDPLEPMDSEAYLEQARQELEGESSLGFQTAFRCRPEDQLALARFFGEEIVLIPRTAIDPDNSRPLYYRLHPGPPARIDTIEEAPPLERFRQYRDLFDFDYSRLPTEIRDLRRRVLPRSEIYLFAALIPIREWALIAARRQEAVGNARQSLKVGRQAPLRRLTLSYRPLPGGRFDLRVDEILFDGFPPYRPDRP